MTDEGYIKFNANWHKQAIETDQALISTINMVRHKLMQKGWLGVLPDGVGFGNISVKLDNGSFLITGSGTGSLPQLDASHFAVIGRVNIAANTLHCTGLTKASSESMTHAVFYAHSGRVNAVIHIHSANLWQKHLHSLPTSGTNAAYGTPEMAFSIEKLLSIEHKDEGVMVMGGHRDGLVAYGNSLQEAVDLLSGL